jgi:hypothetical protein
VINNILMMGLAVAAFVLAPPILGSIAKGGAQTAKGAIEMGGGESGDGRCAEHLKRKSPGYARHKSGIDASSKGKAKGPMTLPAGTVKQGRA